MSKQSKSSDLNTMLHMKVFTNLPSIDVPEQPPEIKIERKSNEAYLRHTSIPEPKITDIPTKRISFSVYQPQNQQLETLNKSLIPKIPYDSLFLKYSAET